jgi:hypothetical protein
VKDWLLFGTSAAFVAVGAVILPSDPEIGVVTLAFFGSTLAVFLGQIITKMRARRFMADSVTVPAGVVIRPQRRPIVIMGLWLFGLGAVLGLVGVSYPPLFRWLGGVIAVIGAALLAGALSGYLPRASWLRFDPGGLTVGQPDWQIQLPWSQVVTLGESYLHGQPMLLIGVDGIYDLPIVPGKAAQKARKLLARTEDWTGAPIAILTSHYGIDLPVLSQAIADFAANDGADLMRPLPP